MKVTGFFSNDVLIGRGCDGRKYIWGNEIIVEHEGDYLKKINVKSLKVHKMISPSEAELNGKFMELVKREGGTAVVKDAHDEDHIAVLCSTFYNLDVLGVREALITKEDRENFDRDFYKKRWILL